MLLISLHEVFESTVVTLVQQSVCHSAHLDVNNIICQPQAFVSGTQKLLRLFKFGTNVNSKLFNEMK